MHELLVSHGHAVTETESDVTLALNERQDGTCDVEVRASDAPAVTVALRQPVDVERLFAVIARTRRAELPLHDPRAKRTHAYFERLSRRDWDGVAAVCDTNVVYTLPGAGRFARRIEGRKAFRDFTAQTFGEFPAARFDGVHVYETPSGVCAEYVGRWRTPDGEDAALPGLLTLQFHGDLISRIGVDVDERLLDALTSPS
jgi:ketosteroid isomerase-like protein